MNAKPHLAVLAPTKVIMLPRLEVKALEIKAFTDETSNWQHAANLEPGIDEASTDETSTDEVFTDEVFTDEAFTGQRRSNLYTTGRRTGSSQSGGAEAFDDNAGTDQALTILRRSSHRWGGRTSLPSSSKTIQALVPGLDGNLTRFARRYPSDDQFYNALENHSEPATSKSIKPSTHACNRARITSETFTPSVSARCWAAVHSSSEIRTFRNVVPRGDIAKPYYCVGTERQNGATRQAWPRIWQGYGLPAPHTRLPCVWQFQPAWSSSGAWWVQDTDSATSNAATAARITIMGSFPPVSPARQQGRDHGLAVAPTLRSDSGSDHGQRQGRKRTLTGPVGDDADIGLATGPGTAALETVRTRRALTGLFAGRARDYATFAFRAQCPYTKRPVALATGQPALCDRVRRRHTELCERRISDTPLVCVARGRFSDSDDALPDMDRDRGRITVGTDTDTLAGEPCDIERFSVATLPRPVRRQRGLVHADVARAGTAGRLATMRTHTADGAILPCLQSFVRFDVGTQDERLNHPAGLAIRARRVQAGRNNDKRGDTVKLRHPLPDNHSHDESLRSVVCRYTPSEPDCTRVCRYMQPAANPNPLCDNRTPDPQGRRPAPHLPDRDVMLPPGFANKNTSVFPNRGNKTKPQVTAPKPQVESEARMGTKQRVPHGLGPEGKKLFREITADFDFTGEAHKKRILIDACKTADAISRLEAESQTQPITTRGSMGQEVISPTLAACALARKDLAHFLSRLALPASEEEQAAKQDRISQARRRAAKIRAS